VNGWTIFWLSLAAFWLACVAYGAYNYRKASVIENHDKTTCPKPMHPDHARIIHNYSRGRYWS
jgi:hypothetical protein